MSVGDGRLQRLRRLRHPIRVVEIHVQDRYRPRWLTQGEGVHYDQYVVSAFEQIVGQVQSSDAVVRDIYPLR